MEDNEIPPDILQKSDEFELLEAQGDIPRDDPSTSGGRRKRREVDYSADLMTDDQFLRTLEEEVRV